MKLRQAKSAPELDDARAMMRGLVAWHRQRHQADLALIERYFDKIAFERELQALPGPFAAPRGRLYLAYEGSQPRGCAALRDIGDNVCEMKRMFVPSEFRGQGIGSALARRLIVNARLLGYRCMRLDTSRHQAEAIKLYEGLGFLPIEAYYAVSDEMRDWLLFFELDL